MTEDERHELTELKMFLKKAINQTQDALISFSVSGSKQDYSFLINKAIMYRDTPEKVISQLQSNNEQS